MDGRKAKLSQFIFMDDAGDLVLSGEIANTLEGFEAKRFAKQNNLTLSTACWLNRKNITACETKFQRFDLLLLQSFLFSENK